MVPRGRMYRYPPGRNMPEVPMAGVAGGMLSVPYDGGMPMRDVGMGQPIPISALASALANATSEQQRTVSSCINSVLFPLISTMPEPSVYIFGFGLGYRCLEKACTL